MTLDDILSAEDIHLDVEAERRGDVLRFLSQKAAEKHPVDAGFCAEALMGREKLGSTGLGRGIAIPHAAIKGLLAPVAIFARLAKPVDFAAVDEEPVDIVFMLLLPEQPGGEQVKVLSIVARLLRDHDVVARLRAAPDREAVLAALSPPRPES